MVDEAADYVLPQDIFEIQDDASARPVLVRGAATRAGNRSATVIGCGSRCPQPSHSGTWCFALLLAWRPGAASVVRGWNLSGTAVTRHRERARGRAAGTSTTSTRRGRRMSRRRSVTCPHCNHRGLTVTSQWMILNTSLEDELHTSDRSQKPSEVSD